MTDKRKIRVLIVDDSALMRELLSQLFAQDGEFEVVGAAPSAALAWQKLQQTAPDVLTLDVEMPQMDGITFLEKVMRTRPLPVVMVSTLTERGCATTLRALEAGAVDFVTKPKVDIRTGTVALAEELLAKVRNAARARVRMLTPLAAPALFSPEQKARQPRRVRPSPLLIAIGASTGGTEALRVVLQALPRDSPGVLVVQHMPAGFTRAFAARLDTLCAITVREARDGDAIEPGRVLLAPGGLQMRVERAGAGWAVSVKAGPPVNHHNPSVDVLFDSCAAGPGSNTIAAILTGMGTDGARGMLGLRRCGAQTVAQDRETCVVFGMPREAIALGAAEQVLPLEEIGPALVRSTRPR